MGYLFKSYTLKQYEELVKWIKSFDGTKLSGKKEILYMCSVAFMEGGFPESSSRSVLNDLNLDDINNLLSGKYGDHFILRPHYNEGDWVRVKDYFKLFKVKKINYNVPENDFSSCPPEDKFVYEVKAANGAVMKNVKEKELWNPSEEEINQYEKEEAIEIEKSAWNDLGRDWLEYKLGDGVLAYGKVSKQWHQTHITKSFEYDSGERMVEVEALDIMFDGDDVVRENIKLMYPAERMLPEGWDK